MELDAALSDSAPGDTPDDETILDAVFAPDSIEIVTDPATAPDEIDPPDPAPPDWMEWMRAGPPAWYRVTGWTLDLITALCGAMVIMLQWFLWLILTSQIARPYGMGIGLVIGVTQMMLLFDERIRRANTCPAPPRK